MCYRTLLSSTAHASVGACHPKLFLSVAFGHSQMTFMSRSGSVRPSCTLFEVRRVLVATKGYLATRTVSNNSVALTDWKWLALAPVQNVPSSLRSDDGDTMKIKPTPHLFTNDAHALHHLAHAETGLAFVPEFLVAPDIDNCTMEMGLPE